jgi:hypothetical protein
MSMSRVRFIIVALLLFAAYPTQDASAIDHNCSEVFCGYRCQVFADFKGWCLYYGVQTTGCIQYLGPQCASLQNAYCCTGNGFGAF